MTPQLDAARSNIAVLGCQSSDSVNGWILHTSVTSPTDNLHRPSSTSVPLHSGRVLLAEDDNDLREVMTFFLTQMGYSVTACGEAECAFEAFHCDAHIEILLTDLEMPGRSGLELARELTDLRPSLAVMIVSGAFITPEMSAEIKERNWKLLSKPCGLPVVLSVLQSLHSKQAQSSLA